ncbi:MAG: hypothetical protein PVSMB7_01010 [Chloroflexota bacterium]
MVRSYRREVAGALLAIGFIAGSGSAWAQGKAGARGSHAHAAPIAGVITATGPGQGSLQVRTASGTATVTLSSTTHVMRVAPGSAADLIPRALVELHLVQGTTTVDAVRIAPANKGLRGSRTAGSVRGARAHTGVVTKTGRLHAGSAKRAHLAGQITTVSSNMITLQGRNAQTATYTLANTVTVVKMTPATLSDLAIGQNVKVIATSGNAAIAVTIVNA